MEVNLDLVLTVVLESVADLDTVVLVTVLLLMESLLVAIYVYLLKAVPVHQVS